MTEDEHQIAGTELIALDVSSAEPAAIAVFAAVLASLPSEDRVGDDDIEAIAIYARRCGRIFEQVTKEHAHV